MVLHARNAEFIGIWHRTTQTLYLLHLIEPDKQENYGKLQIGLYMAAIQDTLDRVRQIEHQNDQAEAIKVSPDLVENEPQQAKMFPEQGEGSSTSTQSSGGQNLPDVKHVSLSEVRTGH